MTKSRQKLIALVLLMAQAVLAAIIVATPGSLGIPPVAIAWAAVANVGVGVWLNGLPTVWQDGA